AGLGLLGTYTFYAVVTATASSRLIASFLSSTGIWASPPDGIVLLFVALVLVGVLWLTVSPVRLGPRVLLTGEGATVALSVVVTWVGVMGAGTDEKGLAAFASAGWLFGELGSSYVGVWLGDLISLGAAVSAFGCALACCVGASRLLYAMAGDGVGPAALARVA